MNQKSKNSSIFEILNKYDIKPNKFMGQNFLVDENVLHKIIETANLPTDRQGIKSDDTILEVGPGLGILTLELAQKAKRVIAIEKDENLCEALEKILRDQKINNVEIINEDVLKIQNSEIESKFKIKNYKLVANIPYYLTSPLIRKFLEAEKQPECMVLMIQKEVAERICAKPPKMSLLAVSVQFYAKPEIISLVSKNSFYPVPKVDSAIIKIIPQRIPKIDAGKFFELVKMGFSAKRKMLINNLKGFDVRGSKLEDIFDKIGLDRKLRAENLTIDDWIKLYTFLGYVDT